MELPPLEPLDIESLDPAYHDLTLELPSIPAEDVSLAVRGFSARLQEVSGQTAMENPVLFTDVIGRAMLAVSVKILEEPEAVFGPFRVSDYGRWKRRRVSLMAPSAAHARGNQAAVVERLRALGATDNDIEHLFWMSTIAVVGSLATIGRLPMQEVPAVDSYN